MEQELSPLGDNLIEGKIIRKAGIFGAVCLIFTILLNPSIILNFKTLNAMPWTRVISHSYIFASLHQTKFGV